MGFKSPALAVGADGVNHLAYTFGLQPARVAYRRCASDCGNGANWLGAEVAAEPDSPVDFVRLGVAGDGRLHLVYETYDMASPRTWYATCASGCTTPGNWSKLELTTIVGGTRGALGSAPLTVDASGRVSLVTADLPPNQPQRLTTCAANCTAAGSWTSGAIRTGGYPLRMVAEGTTLHMVANNEAGALGESLILTVTTKADQTLTARVCDANCGDAASWQSAVLDSRARLDVEADPFMLLGCIDSMGNTVRPLFANWYPNAPVVGIAPSSRAVTVVHAPYVIRTCSSSPTRLAGIGRALYLP